MGKKKDKKQKRAKQQVVAAATPKGLGKAGKAALKLAGSPVVSKAVAAALLAAAAALREPAAARKGAKAVGDAATDGGAAAGRQANVLGDAVKAVAIDVAKRTMAAWEESGRKGGKSKGAG